MGLREVLPLLQVVRSTHRQMDMIPYFLLCVQELYDGLESYVKEQGLTPEVLADLLEFYSKFEQQCYVKGFLHEVRQFMRT